MLVRRHFHGRLVWAPATNTVSMLVECLYSNRVDGTDFCGPGCGARKARYSSITMPVTPIRRSNRDRVKLLRSTLLGGIWAFAAFQLSPPPGRSMVNASASRPFVLFLG